MVQLYQTLSIVCNARRGGASMKGWGHNWQLELQIFQVCEVIRTFACLIARWAKLARSLISTIPNLTHEQVGVYLRCRTNQQRNSRLQTGVQSLWPITKADGLTSGCAPCRHEARLYALPHPEGHDGLFSLTPMTTGKSP